MTADWTVLLVLATLIRSAFGFGEALVAVPLPLASWGGWSVHVGLIMVGTVLPVQSLWG